jgi:hypothetical protein
MKKKKVLNGILNHEKRRQKVRRLLISLITTFLVFGFAISSHAILIDRGGGMIYSTDMNVTWLQDAKYARTSGYDADGEMNWDNATKWAQDLSYGGYDDWRLPTYVADQQRDDAPPEHEMAYLLYTELGNNDVDLSYDYGPFINVLEEDDVYWSSTEFPPNNAGYLYMGCG